MSARIRLKKFGTKKRPYYRIVVMDNRDARDGKTIEELGYYHPIEAEDKQIQF
ncbi:MAG: 30S ribosomal protein S16, partial [Treponema sp.]|nr:30S ribosomal protein S16 [Treponema sp.]